MCVINLTPTEVQNLDFRGSPNVAIEKINSWVANSTQGKIKKLFLEPLDPNTVFVACNVIFLNAKWVNKFDSRLTRNGVFYTGNENITIPMMTSDMRVPYARDDKSRFEIVSLPYEGNRYSMYILRPLDNAGISDLIQLEKTLNPDYLNSLIDQMTTERLLVTLPRMRLYQDLDLKVDLKSLGVDQIFSERLANFERLSDKQGLFVSDIFHKAVLDVTEEGTSAAAVTASVISPTSLPGRFIVDKPSLLFIRDNKNGLILFWAKVIRPEKLTA
ncbi:Serpin B11 [Armadillidium vulgare]|nr:Serpin B11 [Armadillidium vulgare]